MASDAPTIAETIDEIQAALREYIEATYHVGHPTIIEQRRQLLASEGVLFSAPFIESTPRYQTNRTFAELDVDAAVHDLFDRAHPEGRRTRPAAVRPAVHPSGRSPRVDVPRRQEPGHHDRYRFGQDRVLPASDAGQARDRGHAPAGRRSRRPPSER